MTQKRWTSGTEAKKRMAGALLACALVLPLYACSEDDAGAGSSDGSPTSAPAGPTGEDEAQALVDALLERPTSIELDVPLGQEAPRDLDLYFVAFPTLEMPLFEGHVRDAVRPLGWTVTAVDAGATPESTQGAMDRVIRDRPDVALIVSVDPDVISEQVRQATDNGTKVVYAGMPADAADFGGAGTVSGADYHKTLGSSLASYVVVSSEESANTVVFDPTDVAVIRDGTVAGFVETYETLCPDCSLDVQEVSAADIGEGLPSTIVGYLRQHPEVEYVMLGWGGMATGIPGALADAGLDPEKIKIVTATSNPALRTQIAAGDQFVHAVLHDDIPERAYLWADTVIRAAAGVDVSPPIETGTATWLLTEETLEEWPGGDPNEDLPMVDDWAEQFFELWGVEG